ncbi:hypothetical protein L208DRAFT_1402302 [Tricholoma matsutake]|nr:hypothetical protein L208DRAFT_1402302 [Tricholoma matsutake 945]
MTGDAHASYFGQHTVPTEAQAAAGTSTGRSLSNNLSTQTLGTADAAVRQTQRCEKSPADPELAGSTFQTNVISKLDDLVQNFKQDKHREERVGRGEQGVRVRDGSVQEEEAELLLRRICREVLCKRRRSVSSSSGSEDDSESGRRDSKSNKKKRPRRERLMRTKEKHKRHSPYSRKTSTLSSEKSVER